MSEGDGEVDQGAGPHEAETEIDQQILRLQPELSALEHQMRLQSRRLLLVEIILYRAGPAQRNVHRGNAGPAQRVHGGSAQRVTAEGSSADPAQRVHGGGTQRVTAQGSIADPALRVQGGTNGRKRKRSSTDREPPAMD